MRKKRVDIGWTESHPSTHSRFSSVMLFPSTHPALSLVLYQTPSRNHLANGLDMTVAELSKAELSEVESLLIEALRESEDSIPPEQILNALAKRGHRFPTSLVRRALWHLISLRKIEFTGDMRVKLVA